ncbi:MAG TPA: ABC transporter substrate-binding protein [Polyangiaceae bacterium]|nr:ABC transporter substrate-binding protein [Polyangiaceae bacterium]
MNEGSLSLVDSDSIQQARVGRYRLITRLGSGGMADVYLAVSGAESARFQKLLVVKILKSELVAEPDFIEMFLDEARLAARLSHPHVIQTLEVGHDGGHYFLAMEYLEGQPLNRLIHALDSLPGFDLYFRLTVLVRALSGLDYAHELSDYDGTPLSVVHRDVSPGNILVGYDGQIKLTDFGIAKARDSTTQTRVGVFKGKTAYMAPEQAKAGEVDRRADIYSAGVILWELIVGRRMWPGLTQTEIFSRLIAGNLPLPSKVNGSVPAALERICLKALARRKEDRYPSAAALAEDIEGYLRSNFAPRSERDLGRVIADAYSGDRARVREVIEAELRSNARGSELMKRLVVGEGPPETPRTDVSGLASTRSYGARQPSVPIALSASQPPLPGAAPPGSGKLKRLAGFGALLVGVAVALGLALRARADGSSAKSPDVQALVAAAAQQSSPPQESARGVTANEITLGMSAVFSGPTRQLGENMKLGLETAFWLTNQQGGVHGRKLSLVALDDGYEAARVPETMRDLIEARKVFAVIGNVGTPTSAVAAPYASQQKTIFFGAFTGAPVLRQDPPDRYVFNYRASYREETAATVRYLVQVQKLPIDQIAVFAQEDSFGDAGYDGVSKAVRQLGYTKDVLRVGYKRNTVDVDAALTQLLKYHDRTEPVHVASSTEVIHVIKHPVKAVLMVATYRAASKFIQKMREVPRLGKPLVFNVSFVGTEALADDLKSVDSTLCSNVYVTQVVPPFDSGATGVRRYRDALSKYQPQAQPGFVSLEGFIVGSTFVEALARAGSELGTEKLVDTLEQFKGVDLGFGSQLSFSLSEHQGSHKVWGTRLDEKCRVLSADLE